MPTIADYPRSSRPLDGGELIAAFQDGRQIAIPIALIAATGKAPASAPAAGAYRYGGFAVDGIQADEILMEHHVVQRHVIPADLGGCGASAGVLPATPWTLTMEANGTPIGAMTIDPTGTLSTSTVGGVAYALKPGDVVSAVAPSIPDTAIGRVRFTFLGVVS